jgi:hypothetical protein
MMATLGPRIPSSQISTRSSSSCATGSSDFCPRRLRPAAGVVLGVIAIVCVFPGLFALTTVFERKGLGRMQNRSAPIAWAPSAFAARRRRHQVAHQGRHCSAQRQRGGAFSCAAGAGGHGLHGLRGACPWAATWCWSTWMPACSSFSPWARRRSFRSSWPAGRAATSIRCSAPCAPWRR